MKLIRNLKKEINWEEEVDIRLTKKEFAVLTAALWSSNPNDRMKMAERYFSCGDKEIYGVHYCELAHNMTDIINNLF